jgi:hypothetical protein
MRSVRWEPRTNVGIGAVEGTRDSAVRTSSTFAPSLKYLRREDLAPPNTGPTLADVVSRRVSLSLGPLRLLGWLGTGMYPESRTYLAT